MATYNLLIIDDEELRVDSYKDILKVNEQFNLDFVRTPDEMSKIETTVVDGYIIDVILDKNWEGVELETVLKRIGNRGPVFMVSDKWKELEEQVVESLNRSMSSQVKYYFVWKDSFNVAGNIDKNSAASFRWNILNQLHQYHGRSSTIPKQDETINIVHISDTQFGDPKEDKSAIFSETTIGNYLRRKKIAPHFLVVTGDITFSGQPKEYEEAAKWFRQFIEELWPNNFEKMRERILLVPGNHDVNLRLCNADNYKVIPNEDGDVEIKKINKKDVEYDHKKYGLTPFRLFAYRLTEDIRWINEDNFFWVTDRFLNFGLRFYSLNSVDSVGIKNAKKYFISKESLFKIRDMLGPNWDKKSYNIALSHHGFPQPRYEDAEPIENWKEICSFLETYKMNLFIHGHGHAWNVRQFQEEEYLYDMVVAMAPTTHLKGVRRPPEQRRGFNLIQLNREDGEVKNIKGTFFPMEAGRIDERSLKSHDWDVKL